MLDLRIHSEEPREVHGRSGRILELRPEIGKELEGFLETYPIFDYAGLKFSLIRLDINADYYGNSSHAVSVDPILRPAIPIL